jgi:hypothetical protein
MRAILVFLVTVGTLLVTLAETNAQQRYIVRPGPYYVPRPLPQPRMMPYQYRVVPNPRIPGQTAGNTCYMVRNGICYRY